MTITFEYQEILRINGISFCRLSRKPESHLWDATYLSEPLREIKKAEDAVERVMARLENRDGREIDETEHAREIIEAQGRQRKR
jgi:hypothetical protein